MGRQVTEQTVDTEANQAKISTIMCHRCGKMGHTRKNCKGKVYCEKCKTATHATVACKKTEGYQPKTPAQQGTNRQGHQPRVAQPLGTNQRAYQPKQTWQEKSQKCFRAIEENNTKHEQLVELSKYCTRELDKESERTAPTERDIEAELDKVTQVKVNHTKVVLPTEEVIEVNCNKQKMTNDDNMKTVIMKRFSRSPGDRELPSCPDTGAGWTILGHNVALKSGLKIDTSTKDKFKLKNASKEEMKVIGTVTFFMQVFDGQGKPKHPRRITALVSPDLGDDILVGRNDLKILGVISPTFPDADYPGGYEVVTNNNRSRMMKIHHYNGEYLPETMEEEEEEDGRDQRSSAWGAFARSARLLM